VDEVAGHERDRPGIIRCSDQAAPYQAQTTAQPSPTAQQTVLPPGSPSPSFEGETWSHYARTNVMLAAQRFARRARDELFGALEKLGDRLWIPHQVALEHRAECRFPIKRAPAGRRDQSLAKASVPSTCRNKPRQWLWCWSEHVRERSVKQSAQPTLVRTQHLPPPAKTAR